jgi:hypothetical protein
MSPFSKDETGHGGSNSPLLIIYLPLQQSIQKSSVSHSTLDLGITVAKEQVVLFRLLFL